VAGEELCYLDLVDVGRRIRARELSSVDVTRAQLERIARLEPRLKSYATPTPEIALAQAAHADEEIARGLDRGPLHGVPIAVKDLYRTQGIVTAVGMSIYKDYVPDRDATVIARLKNAGAVLLGKLQMTEGAFSAHASSVEPPVNPWSAAHWSGVSSSGSGVATAAGLCYAALGSDTLGSIRFPCTVNGITGLKPTWGRVSRAGAFALAETMDHVGPMARSAADCAAVLSVIAGADADDPTAAQVPVPDYLADLDTNVRGLRIGLDRRLVDAGADRDMARVVDEVSKLFVRLGAILHDVALPPLDDAARDAVTLCAAEAAVAHEATFPARAAEYGPVLTRLIETGRQVDGVTLAKVLERRALFSGKLAALFQDVDLLLLPAMNETAPTIASMATRVADPEARVGRIRFTAPFNLSGSPCLVLCGGETVNNLPVGFQLVARHFEEALALRAGHAFQQATGWHRRRPTL
jgi:amidase